MSAFALAIQWIIGVLLLISALGVIFIKKPVHACLSFLVTLMLLAVTYFELSAQFIGVMQVLVYAGAILVLFMFVIILFQDAYQQLAKSEPQSNQPFLWSCLAVFLVAFVYLGRQFLGVKPLGEILPEGYGTVQSLGYRLYLDLFFPFEAVIFVFLVALIGTVYIGRKST